MAKPDNRPGLDARITQSIRALTRREERKSKFFFIRRRPAWRMRREWTQPPPEEYKKLLIEEGFISAPLLEKKNLSTALDTDVRELEEHLLPFFWRMNQQAKFYQNRYYQYQWSFILSAFTTTALAAINVFFYAQGWHDNTIAYRIQPSEVLGLLTAVVSGVAAAVTFLDSNQTPQKRWFKARAQAESLRSMYFLYLARARPFDTIKDRDRVHTMRQKVIEVLRDNSSSAARSRVNTPLVDQTADKDDSPEGDTP